MPSLSSTQKLIAILELHMNGTDQASQSEQAVNKIKSLVKAKMSQYKNGSPEERKHRLYTLTKTRLILAQHLSEDSTIIVDMECEMKELLQNTRLPEPLKIALTCYLNKDAAQQKLATEMLTALVKKDTPSSNPKERLFEMTELFLCLPSGAQKEMIGSRLKTCIQAVIKALPSASNTSPFFASRTPSLQSDPLHTDESDPYMPPTPI